MSLIRSAFSSASRRYASENIIQYILNKMSSHVTPPVSFIKATVHISKFLQHLPRQNTISSSEASQRLQVKITEPMHPSICKLCCGVAVGGHFLGRATRLKAISESGGNHSRNFRNYCSIEIVMITQEGLKTDLVPVIDYLILFPLSQRLEDESQ